MKRIIGYSCSRSWATARRVGRRWLRVHPENQAATCYAKSVDCRSFTSLLILVGTMACTAPAWAEQYPLPTPDIAVVGEDHSVTTVYEDTLYDLARTYSLGSEELIRVNQGMDPWLPGAGKTVIIPGRHILPPGPREGI